MFIKKILIVLLVLFFNQMVFANDSCRNIFIRSEMFESRLKSLDRLYRTGLLNDVILVNHSPLLLAIFKASLEEVKLDLEKRQKTIDSSVFFDEILFAIANNENTIASYLFEQSHFDYRRTPLGKDLMMAAVYFGNLRMLEYFYSKGLRLVKPERLKAIQYARLSRSYNIVDFLSNQESP